VAPPFTMPLPLVLIPVQAARIARVLKGRPVTSTHHVTISPQVTSRTNLFCLFLWTHISVVPILLMRQQSAICPVPLEVQQNVQLVKHAMEIRHATVATRLFVGRLGMMRQVNVKFLVQPDWTKNAQLVQNVLATHLAQKAIHSTVELISSRHQQIVPFLVRLGHRLSVLLV